MRLRPETEIRDLSVECDDPFAVRRGEVFNYRNQGFEETIVGGKKREVFDITVDGGKAEIQWGNKMIILEADELRERGPRLTVETTIEGPEIRKVQKPIVAIVRRESESVATGRFVCLEQRQFFGLLPGHEIMETLTEDEIRALKEQGFKENVKRARRHLIELRR